MTSTAQAPTNTLDTVLSYAARGWPVFPLYGIRNGVCSCRAGAACKESSGKHPLTQRGFHDASLDPTQIRTWHLKHPGCNWAIRTGQALPQGGFLVVLDIDPRNSGDETLAALEREHGELPRTTTSVSGGNGAHYLFEAPAAIEANLGEGIDAKSGRGYIVAPPSLHYSGRHYAWDVARHPDDTPIAKLPEWVSSRPAPATRPEHDGVDAAESIMGEAFRLAGLLRERLPEGRRMAVCPWLHEHSDKRGDGTDSSTVLLPPSLQSQFGGFKCLHGHCSQRGWRDVFAVLPASAVAQARAKYAVRSVPAAAPSEPPPASAAPSAPATAPAEPDWKQFLIYKRTKGGASLQAASANVITILTHDPRWKGRIRYDEFADATRVTDPPWAPDDAPTSSSPEWADEDDVRLQAWLLRQNEYQLDVGVATVTQAVAVVAKSNAYHAVREYLSGLTWDGTARIDRFFVTFFGAEDTEYTRAVGARWLISAVARAFRPGCKVDCMPVLEGSQGSFKSSALRALAGDEWFFDSNLPIGDKDAYQNLKAKWICEFPELDKFSKGDVNKVKAFLSQQDDHYRSSHGRHARSHKRHCVFCASTNDHEYNRDSTGARRIWPVRIGLVKLELIREYRDQIWAEAVVQFQLGKPWYLDTPELKALAEEEQDDRYQADPWEDPISRWLLTANREAGVTTFEVLTGPLNVEVGRVCTSMEMRVASVLRRLGWGKVTQCRAGGKRVRRYKLVTDVTEVVTPKVK